jgi:hypothetical protein
MNPEQLIFAALCLVAALGGLLLIVLIEEEG